MDDKKSNGFLFPNLSIIKQFNIISMSNVLGSNFLYQAKDFLDARVNLAKAKKDLLNWNIPVPEGFKICLDGEWYYYKESVNLPDTGHWIPEKVNKIGKIQDPGQTLAGNALVDLSVKLSSLDQTLVKMVISSAQIRAARQETFENHFKTGIYFEGSIQSTEPAPDLNQYEDYLYKYRRPESETVTNSILLEPGSYIIPEIKWTTNMPSIGWKVDQKTGKMDWRVLSDSTQNKVESMAVVTCDDPNITGYTNQRQQIYLGQHPITFNSSSNRKYTYTIEAYSSSSNNTTIETVTIDPMWKIRIGTSGFEQNRPSTVELSKVKEQWVSTDPNNTSLNLTYTFDLSKEIKPVYPFFIIPTDYRTKEYVAENLEMKINGHMFTAWDIKENYTEHGVWGSEYGYSCTMVYITTPQTGNITVELKLK